MISLTYRRELNGKMCILELDNDNDINDNEYLDLSGYEIFELNGIVELNKHKPIVQLQLWSNNITNVKNVVGSELLPDLKILNLRSNLIENFLEDDIVAFTNLVNLEISKNRITSLAGLNCLHNLEYVYANNNLIQKIPELNLNKLSYLSVSDNKIDEICDQTNLGNLKYFFANNNKISDVKSISEIKSIEELQLDGNEISDIRDFGKLTNLTHLCVERNKITAIPETLINCEYLLLLKHDQSAKMPKIINKLIDDNIYNNKYNNKYIR
jgi:Leucine-rich repeat (LRR) protein